MFIVDLMLMACGLLSAHLVYATIVANCDDSLGDELHIYAHVKGFATESSKPVLSRRNSFKNFFRAISQRIKSWPRVTIYHFSPKVKHWKMKNDTLIFEFKNCSTRLYLFLSIFAWNYFLKVENEKWHVSKLHPISENNKRVLSKVKQKTIVTYI